MSAYFFPPKKSGSIEDFFCNFFHYYHLPRNNTIGSQQSPASSKATGTLPEFFLLKENLKLGSSTGRKRIEHNAPKNRNSVGNLPFVFSIKINSALILTQGQRYKYRVLQTIQMKLILLCVSADRAVFGSAKTALEFKYNI